MPFTEHSDDTVIYNIALDVCSSWLKHWGSGGGCYSLETWINDKLEELDNNATIAEIKKHLLDNDPGYGCNSTYGDVVVAMIGDITEVKEGENNI